MRLVDHAAKSLGLRQRSYQSLFAEGSPGHHVLAELALFSKAFSGDVDNISHDMLMTMHGRRQMFFLIVNHLKLSPLELDGIYHTAAIRAPRLVQGAEE